MYLSLEGFPCPSEIKYSTPDQWSVTEHIRVSVSDYYYYYYFMVLTFTIYYFGSLYLNRKCTWTLHNGFSMSQIRLHLITQKL